MPRGYKKDGSFAGNVYQKGKIFSDDEIKKRSESIKKLHKIKVFGFKKGNHPLTEFKKGHNKGGVQPWVAGEKSHFWKGGISKVKNYKRLRKEFYLKRKVNNGGHHFESDWIKMKERYNYICPDCGKSEPEIKLTEDHITPILMGGDDNIENIQPLCPSCNSRKHTKTIKFPIKFN